jgi:ATP-dependent RNA helicase RhlE
LRSPAASEKGAAEHAPGVAAEKKEGIMGFTAFKLHPKIMTGVRALGYATPTPIQVQAIPPVLEGRDVMGLAQTGTGKTAAFVLPILERLLPGPRGRVRALIIAPTRELAEQIHVAIVALGRDTRLRSCTIYGGVGLQPQIQRLRDGVDIVVACPGRLLDHINQRTIDLSHLEILVLDEADRMFDMGFLPDIRRIIRHLPVKRQNLMYSATMADDIRKLAHDVLRHPVTVQVGHTAPANTVSHALYPVEQHLKTGLLMEILKHTDTESILIFTRTKHRAKRIGQQLEKAGYKAASLQGNLSQNKRQEALDGFRSGKYQILVATDIAARGIDVSSISHVINYDIPDTTDAYTHRIGRTGRAAKTGDAFTFVSREDEPLVRSIERVLGERIERRTLKDFDYRKAAPARDTEFARPPREPQRRRPQAKPEHAGPRPAAHGRPGTHQAPSHRGAAPRSSSAPASRPSGTRTFKPRTRRSGPGR